MLHTDEERKKIVVIGSGPIRIGQGIEFDYCSVHCVWALREAGYEAIIINNNPETVSTDFDTSDRLFFEPLTAEDVLNILDREAAGRRHRAVRRADGDQSRQAAARGGHQDFRQLVRLALTWPKTATALRRCCANWTFPNRRAAP